MALAKTKETYTVKKIEIIEKPRTHEEIIKEIKQDFESAEIYNERKNERKLMIDLVNARLDAGLSQKDLANMVGTGQSKISKYEKEEVFQLSIKNLQKIAKALGKELKIELI
jgi:predicted XRE-type DNA-binding protein